jgi:hypothetical protein
MLLAVRRNLSERAAPATERQAADAKP